MQQTALIPSLGKLTPGQMYSNEIGASLEPIVISQSK